MIKIPNKVIWNQNNRSDLLGDIWSSFNIDLTSKVGKLKATRMITIADSGSITGMGLASAFKYYNSNYYATTAGTISRVATTRTGSWVLDTASGKPTTCDIDRSDMEVFNEILYVTGNTTTVYKNSAGTWSSITWSNISSGFHSLCTYAGKLYCAIDYAKIESKNTSDTVVDTFTLSTNPTTNTITFLRAVSDGIWIGTMNQNGGKGYVYKWDGTSSTVAASYRLQSSGAMAGVVKDDTLYIVDNDGRLLYFNGGTFVELDRLPIKIGRYMQAALANTASRWIHPNGMTVQDNRINILIRNNYLQSGNPIEENVPSGVWEWSPDTGLYHKFSLSYYTSSITDYGQNIVSQTGALSYLKSASTSASDNGQILASATLYTNASTTANYICTDEITDTIQKYGYFITPKILSQNYSDTWQRIILNFKKFSTTGDTLTAKYRTSEVDPTYITITTWSGSNTVTTSSTMTGYGVGDEIEFLQGPGSGKCFNILSTTDLGGGVTQINLDGSFTGISNGGKARLQHWKQIGQPFTDQNFDSNRFTITEGATSGWIQFKVSLQHTADVYLYNMNVINKLNEPNQ